MISLFVTMTYLQETMKIKSNLDNCLRRWVAGGGGDGVQIAQEIKAAPGISQLEKSEKREVSQLHSAH